MPIMLCVQEMLCHTQILWYKIEIRATFGKEATLVAQMFLPTPKAKQTTAAGLPFCMFSLMGKVLLEWG